jgi:Zn-dependent M28 family amino/carboxypeptidase
MQTALGKGAIGLIYVYPRVYLHPNGDRIPKFLSAMVSESFFDKLLAPEGTSSKALLDRLSETKNPASFPLGAVIDLSVKATHFPKGKGYNVVALSPGADPGLADECIVIGAHLDGVGDHIGLRFPGAEDNASGCAVVMEIAKAFARNGSRPKRSTVFVLFGSEEQGGRGSDFFAANLPPRFKKISAFINFDMVGMGSKANAGINEFMEKHRPLLAESDEDLSVMGNIHAIKTLGPRSGDIVPFFNKNIPLIILGSNGPRPETLYHQPGDVPSLVQPEIMEKISKLMFRFACRICDAE